MVGNSRQHSQIDDFVRSFSGYFLNWQGILVKYIPDCTEVHVIISLHTFHTRENELFGASVSVLSQISKECTLHKHSRKADNFGNHPK